MYGYIQACDMSRNIITLPRVQVYDPNDLIN